MRSSAMQTPARAIPRPPPLELEPSDGSICTPRPNTSRGPGFARTCMKRIPQLLQLSTTLKRRSAASIVGDSVKVFIRVKPVMEEDLKADRHQVAVTVHEKDGQRGVSIPAGNGKENWFAEFDGVLDDATNQDVFNVVGGNLLDQFLLGVNASIMAYGQTGSGKTYSMFGRDEPGSKVQGLLHMILRRVDEEVCIGTHHSRLSVSVVEVYNEELYSLLDAEGVDRRLLRDGTTGITKYHTLKMRAVSNVEDATGLVLRALQLRTMDSTARNATSSRSHAVVKLRLERLSTVPGEQGTASSLFIVDLAGSENILHAYNKEQQKETTCINKALGALERVVNSLSSRSQHVPYRDSILTQVLQEGLDPARARVALLATISPFVNDLVITKSTLNFAQRARNIRTYAQVNNAPRRQAPSGQEELQRQLQSLQAINNTLRQQLADLDGNNERLSRERHLRAMEEELQRLADLHSELQRTSARHVHEAEAALELERGEHALTRSKMAELQRANGELKRALVAAEEEARAAGGASAELRALVAEAQLEAVRLNGDLAYARALTEEIQSQHKAAQEQLVQAREQLTQLKGQLAVAEAGDSQLQQELRQQLAALQADAQVARNAALAEASALRQHVHDLQADLAEVRQAGSRQAQELADAKDREVQLHDKLSEADAALVGLRQQTEGVERRAEQQAAELQALLGSVAAKGASSVAALTDALDVAEQISQYASAAQADAVALRDRRSQPAPALAAAPAAMMGPDMVPALQPDEHHHVGQDDEVVYDDARPTGDRLRETLEQLGTCTEQLAALEGELAAANEQLEAAEASKGEVQEALEMVQQATQAEIETLRAQLVEQMEVLNQQAAAHAAAVQEARAGAEAAAAARLEPVQTENGRLRATAALSEQQLARLQTECERLRSEAAVAEEELTRLRADRERYREAAARAEAEAAARVVRLEALLEQREAAAVRPEVLKQLQDRLRQVEAEKKKAEADHRGCLELKDKLIRQLELINHQLQSEVTKLRQEAATAEVSDPHGGGGGTSPFTAPINSDRSDRILSPAPGGDNAATPMSAGSAPAASAPRGPPSGILLLNRTTTGSAAALARNTKALRSEFTTPPPAPRAALSFTPAATPGMSPPAHSAGAGGDGASPAPAPADAVPSEVINLITPASTPGGPPEPRLTPTSCGPLDDGYVVVVRRQNNERHLKLDGSTAAVRSQVNA